MGQAGLRASRNPVQFEVTFLVTHSYVDTKSSSPFFSTAKRPRHRTRCFSPRCRPPAAGFLHAGSGFSLGSLASPGWLLLSPGARRLFSRAALGQSVCAHWPRASPQLSHLTSVPSFSALPLKLWSGFQMSLSFAGVCSFLSCFPGCFWMTVAKRKQCRLHASTLNVHISSAWFERAMPR